MSEDEQRAFVRRNPDYQGEDIVPSGPKLDKQGARALAEREIVTEFPGLPIDRMMADRFYVEWGERRAGAILGTTGLFIPDVTKHEPKVDANEAVSCRCGWPYLATPFRTYTPGESYFDHIGAAQ